MPNVRDRSHREQAAAKPALGLFMMCPAWRRPCNKPWSAPVWDFEQTNSHLDKTKVNLESAIGVGGTAAWLAELSPEGRDLLLAADSAYLMAALAGLEARYGSVEGFARAALALPAETIDALRRRVLEP